MLTKEVRLRVERQIKTITEGYRQAKQVGYNVSALSLPSFESQEDHDKYHPNDSGQPFQDHNEFVVEILAGLRANGVPAELVTIYYSEYAQWLKGKPNTSEARSAYGAYLLSKAHLENGGRS